MATFAPCSAKRTAIACPIPDEPPVTRTFFPVRPGMPPRPSCGSAVGAGGDIVGTIRPAASARKTVVRPRDKQDRSGGREGGALFGRRRALARTVGDRRYASHQRRTVLFRASEPIPW